MQRFLAREWQITALVVFAVANLFGIWAAQPLVISGDSVAYFETAKFLGGLEGGVLHPARILKPFGPLLAYLIGQGTGWGVEWGLLLENALWYLLMVPAIYALLRRMSRGNSNQALWGSIIFLCAYPMLAYGVSYMTDISGWFFTVWGYYFVVRFVDERMLRDAFFAGLTMAVGFLCKEYVAAVALFFFLAACFAPGFWWEDRLRSLAFFALPVFVIAGGWQIFCWTVYHVSYLGWYAAGGVSHYELKVVPFMIKSFLGVFLVGWVLALVGLWTLWREGSSRELFLLKLLALPSMSFLLWHVASSRIYFIAAIPAAFLAGVYLERLYKTNRIVFWSVLLCVIVVNYGWYLWGGAIRPALWPGIEL